MLQDDVVMAIVSDSLEELLPIILRSLVKVKLAQPDARIRMDMFVDQSALGLTETLEPAHSSHGPSRTEDNAKH